MLSAFKDYLAEKAVVQDKYVPYYLKWVGDCYGFLDRPESEPTGLEDKERFLKDLAKTHEDWQVSQADNALRIYDYFLSSRTKSVLGNDGDTGGAWASLEARTREALRLRQRSYSTEKTYLAWLPRISKVRRRQGPFRH